MSLATKANAKLAIKTFDYDGIDPEPKSQLIYLAAEAHRETSTHVESAVRLGQVLAQAQAILSTLGCKGKFSSWVELECGFSKSTAYNYIAAFNRFSEEKASKALGLFTLEGVYLLSPESVPQVAVDEAVKMASKGTRINREKATEILTKYRAVQKPKKEKKPGPEPAREPEVAQDAAEEEPDFKPAEIEKAPHPTVDIPGLAAPYKQSVLELGAIINRIKKIASEERTGGHLATKEARIVHDLTEAKVAISEAEPVRVCPKCDGKGCHPCAHTGFWTRAIQKSRK